MNKSQSAIVKEYEFDKPLIQKVDSIIDKCIRGYHNRYLHTFDHICGHDFKLTIIANSESVKITIAEKGIILY